VTVHSRIRNLAYTITAPLALTLTAAMSSAQSVCNKRSRDESGAANLAARALAVESALPREGRAEHMCAKPGPGGWSSSSRAAREWRRAARRGSHPSGQAAELADNWRLNASVGLGPATPPGDATVLVIDQDPDVAALLAASLRKVGYRVKVTGERAVALVDWEAASTEIVLLEPKGWLDGLQVCRRMRQTVPTPVIVVSTQDCTDERQRGLAAGADDYIAKPFMPSDLQLRVQRVLMHHGKHRRDPDG
jgi:CheY-like chemotaxis protein